MLRKEIGRFGDGAEDLKPSELADEVPDALKSGCVGIFWHVGSGRFVIRKANVLDDTEAVVELGQEYDDKTNPGDLQIDYDRFHRDIWEEEIRPKTPEWAGFGFDHFSRGRIVFEVQKHKFVIYAPRSKNMTDNVFRFLAEQFQLPCNGFETNMDIYKQKSDMETLDTKNLKQLLR
ncbi:MAG: hypothetical protein LBM60_01990 [Clostridium sp.]|jgi:hypothetical protein|nr:hypothetical protein [Clostridium sp.]